MFNTRKNMNTNYRNNFTKDYYDSLINGSVDIKAEIKKHRCKNIHDADIILCRTNKECDELNNQFMELNDIEFGSQGCKIICNSNDLRHKNIYNSFTYDILNVKGDNIKLDDETEISTDQSKKYFKPAYAITFYKSQGQEYRSFYVPDSSIKNMTEREAYTIISRLKQDIIKNKKVINKELIVLKLNF
jgi:hypothetical protein